MTKVGEVEQENVPWYVECGEGTFEQRWTFWVTISGGIRLLFRIPKGTEWLSDVLFGGGGIPKQRSRDKVAFPFPKNDAVKRTASLRCVKGLRRHPSRWISGSLESNEREISVTTDDKHYVNPILCYLPSEHITCSPATV